MVVALSGGTGGAKLVEGLNLELDPQRFVVVVNTADDFILHGLHISPDLDTITYTLAGVAEQPHGWGISGDSFAALEWLHRYGRETWFKLGDRDLATHIVRSDLLREGLTLAQATEKIGRSLGVRARILPMSNDRVETRITTPRGEVHFQEFFVKAGGREEVKAVRFAGVEKCRPTPGLVAAIQEASAVILCPSNPVTSLGPILAVPGIKDALRETKATVLSVSPIIAGAAVSGPADRLMAAVGMEVSAAGVARAYSDFLDLFVMAEEDRDRKEEIEALGVGAGFLPIRMKSGDDKRRLARAILSLSQ
jgi:LPPG:FO 2-phospho-L-lactate transferase